MVISANDVTTLVEREAQYYSKLDNSMPIDANNTELDVPHSRTSTGDLA